MRSIFYTFAFLLLSLATSALPFPDSSVGSATGSLTEETGPLPQVATLKSYLKQRQTHETSSLKWTLELLRCQPVNVSQLKAKLASAFEKDGRPALSPGIKVSKLDEAEEKQTIVWETRLPMETIQVAVIRVMKEIAGTEVWMMIVEGEEPRRVDWSQFTPGSPHPIHYLSSNKNLATRAVLYWRLNSRQKEFYWDLECIYWDIEKVKVLDALIYNALDAVKTRELDKPKLNQCSTGSPQWSFETPISKVDKKKPLIVDEKHIIGDQRKPVGNEHEIAHSILLKIHEEEGTDIQLFVNWSADVSSFKYTLGS